ncbi:TadE/TadG family type IV pilus assembly protein [Streptomyces sp. NBC_00239]|uniref:TadE/TadG family type IV pilus assembly protein n=1 Tax=Streptomyces sp. NBC_00239 TaxID=2903640 RepID=UPI002E2BB10C|nr:TadE/TadG family type IV pilus assembly protein [Streptomyces sp. NBC_00239]
MRRARARDDRGSTTFEFLGMFPYILLILMVLWQCVVVGYTFSLAGNAADEAARAGAVGEDCAAAAGEHVGSAWGIEVSCPPDGQLVHATVALQVPVLSPSLFNLNLTITGEAAAVNEREDED